MATPVQTAANRQNALASTGPRTTDGKRRSARNAVCHGLRSEQPVLPGEDAEAWQTHQAGIVANLAPAGSLETELARRVALSLWRLRRLANYETAMTTAGLQEVEEQRCAGANQWNDSLDPDTSDAGWLEKLSQELQEKRETVELWDGTLRLMERLPGLPDDATVDGDDAYGVFEDLGGMLPEDVDVPEIDGESFLTELGVPADECGTAFEWNGWTAGMVRKGVASLARVGRTIPDRLLARALGERRETQAANRAEAAKLERSVRALRGQIRRDRDRERQRRILPDSGTLDKVIRYEAHLSRQMLQALHTLERLQASRAGQPIAAPAALDITLDGPAQAAQRPDERG
jgi:hypothetical protein